jgi:tripartite-type tricarboxylate transporter receptor subunit TctC
MKKVSKYLVILVIIALFATALMGCSGGKSKEPATSGGESEAKKVEFPTKPIRCIIPYAAGGNSDLNARKLAEIIEQYDLLPQPIVVVNIQGGGTMEALNAVNDADPDGYTVMLHHSAILAQANMGQITWTFRDFEPVCQVLEQPSLIVARADNPWNNADELIEAAKKAPGQITWTYSGLGATAHLASEIFWMNTKSRDYFKQVIYQGGADALTAQLGGHVDMRGSTTVDAIRYIKSGDLKAIAVSGYERLADLPDTPTYEELGFKDNFVTRQGIFATKGTPREIVDILAEAFLKACDTPEYEEYLKTASCFKASRGPDEFYEVLDGDDALIAEIVKNLDI